ncbi:Predicted arabinose efflux permease, MFS family [Quadrisphaera granulorum]|uniref:Putative MFS family arabinose efflux permease n=1 Tax=Quadrisphaera granulorum TaxID=317664 RepID=A0A316AH64_9ACTN|nr:MFS transporter [Quadrisphaera granulorum]PWJ56244.1 putative MFS family arabinose efflux permease [Quadrisphaera granulorum]SZE94878.1 Predicted arabinose efflux permease, MFS family [Quadrisphaera granulorum]
MTAPCPTDMQRTHTAHHRARRLVGLALAWAVLSESVPLYPLYSLLFADHGLSEAQISGLFAVWALTTVLAQVPCGALADRTSRRTALVLSGVLQAVGYVLWTVWPTAPSFAAGFVLWGLALALAVGALEALVWDGLAEADEQHRYAKVIGRVRAAQLLGQLPGTLAAVALASWGGYPAVGWASAASCLLAAAVAVLVREPPHSTVAPPEDADVGEVVTAPGALRQGIGVLVHHRRLAAVVVVVGLLTGLDAIDEYTPLLARAWGVPDAVNPLVVLVIPMAGALGAAFGERLAGIRPLVLGGWLVAAAASLEVADLLHQVAGTALVALGYGAYRAVLVVADARLQEHVVGDARATVTSVAGVVSQLGSLALYGLWALWSLPGAVGLFALCAVGAWLALRPPRARSLATRPGLVAAQPSPLVTITEALPAARAQLP